MKASDTKLTTEHIIPFGLAGYTKWADSSCEPCADITKRFERDVLTDMFGASRIHLQIRTRNKKRRPTELGIGIGSTSQNVKFTKVRIEDHPNELVMPILPPPTVIMNGPRSTTFSRVDYLASQIQGDFNDRVNRLGGAVRMDTPIKLESFCRLLAKIAHCCATVEFGTKFIPWLPPYILGEVNTYPYLIGGADQYTTPSGQAPDLLHDVWMHLAHKSPNFSTEALVVICIQLFKPFKTPIYQVVTGHMPPGFMKASNSATQAR